MEPLISLKCKIDMGDSEPVYQKPYPITMKHYYWVRSEMNKLHDVQVIYSSHSTWSAPIIVMPMEDGGKCLVKLCNAELTMTLSKCHFFAKEIQYLGQVLSSTSNKPLPLMTAAIMLMNPLKMLNR